MIFSENIKAIVFDMDGVLLDTESLCKVCWTRAANEFSVDDIDLAFIQCVGQNTTDTLEVLKKYCEGKVEPKVFYERTGELFHAVENESGLQKMPFVSETLENLRKRGFRLALASSTKWTSVERQLKNAGIFDFFETFTTGDKVTHAKPNPEIYLKAVASLGLPAEACIAVEDSPNGVRAATQAGLKCIMVPDQIQPDEEMKKISWRIVPSLKYLIS